MYKYVHLSSLVPRLHPPAFFITSCNKAGRDVIKKLGRGVEPGNEATPTIHGLCYDVEVF